jgi:hypothetical protein
MCDERRLGLLVERGRYDEPPSFRFGYRELSAVAHDVDVRD